MNGTSHNVSNQYPQKWSFFTTAEIVVGATSMVILMLLAFLGNLLTCVVFCRKPQLRTPTNVSIVILAVTHVLSAIFMMPLSLASFISGGWILGSTACVFNAYAIQALLGMTFISMTSTAVIRYFCVVRASLHHHLKPKRTLYVILTLWIMYLLLVAIPCIVEFPEGHYNVRRSFCRLAYKSNKVNRVVSLFVLTLGGVFTLVMFTAYYNVFRFVSHHNHAVAPNLQHGMSSHTEEAKITKTLVIVVVGFVMCWVPTVIIEIMNIVNRYYKVVKVPVFAIFLQTIFIFTSSAINPLIYTFTNRRFKREYLEFLRSVLP